MALAPAADDPKRKELLAELKKAEQEATEEAVDKLREWNRGPHGGFVQPTGQRQR